MARTADPLTARAAEAWWACATPWLLLDHVRTASAAPGAAALVASLTLD